MGASFVVHVCSFYVVKLCKYVVWLLLSWMDCVLRSWCSWRYALSLFTAYAWLVLPVVLFMDLCHMRNLYRVKKALDRFWVTLLQIAVTCIVWWHTWRGSNILHPLTVCTVYCQHLLVIYTPTVAWMCQLTWQMVWKDSMSGEDGDAGWRVCMLFIY